MCYMVVVGLPASRKSLWFDRLPAGIGHWPARYSHLAELMTGYVPEIIGLGGCSCHLFCDASLRDSSQDKLAKLRTKYEKRGWSETKIERALSQVKSENSCGLQRDVQLWLADAALDCGKVFVYVHWDSAEIAPAVVTISADELREDFVVRDEQLVCIR